MLGATRCLLLDLRIQIRTPFRTQGDEVAFSDRPRSVGDVAPRLANEIDALTAPGVSSRGFGNS